MHQEGAVSSEQIGTNVPARGYDSSAARRFMTSMRLFRLHRLRDDRDRAAASGHLQQRGTLTNGWMLWEVTLLGNRARVSALYRFRRDVPWQGRGAKWQERCDLGSGSIRPLRAHFKSPWRLFLAIRLAGPWWTCLLGDLSFLSPA